MMPILETKTDRSPLRRFLQGILDVLLRRAPRNAAPGADRSDLRGNTRKAARTEKTQLRRLAKEAACLERLEVERERLGDSRFGLTTEYRIIWGELLELELQDIDEQMTRICEAAGGDLQSNPGAGDPHGPGGS